MFSVSISCFVKPEDSKMQILENFTVFKFGLKLVLLGTDCFIT